MIKKCPVCFCDISVMIPDEMPDEEINFCPICGANFRYSCPVCRNGIISIKGLSEKTAMRCPSCESLFYSCEKCGRLATPYDRRCPDEECGGLLRAENLPRALHDGTGFCDTLRIDFGFSPQDEGESSDLPYEGEELLPGCERLHGAVAAGGRLFAWHDSLIDVFNMENEYEKSRSFSALGTLEPKTAPVMLVLADNIIIPSSDRFHWFNLNGEMEVDIPGEPCAAAAGDYAAVMWTRSNGRKRMFAALAPQVNSTPLVKEIPMPEESWEIHGSNVVMGHHSVFWQGSGGNLHKYDVITEEYTEIPFEAGFADFLWTDRRGGVSAARYDSVKLCVTEDAGGENRETFKSFENYVTGMFVNPDGEEPMYAYVLDNRIMRNGEGRFAAPNGDHVESVMALDQQGSPVLLSLFRNNQLGRLFTDLYAQKRDSNVPERLWSNPDIVPRGMLCADGSIFILHHKGIIRLERKERAEN